MLLWSDYCIKSPIRPMLSINVWGEAFWDIYLFFFVLSELSFGFFLMGELAFLPMFNLLSTKLGLILSLDIHMQQRCCWVFVFCFYNFIHGLLFCYMRWPSNSGKLEQLFSAPGSIINFQNQMVSYFVVY